MSQSIAIVGASARAAAASAGRAGFQPITADLFADADLRTIATATRISPYPEGILDWLRVLEPSAWMYTGALENHPELVDEMAWIAPLWGNPGDVLTRVRSPWELAAELHVAGLRFPETRASAAGLPHDGSWLAKTYRGASGSGVREWSDADRGGEGEKGRGGELDAHLPFSHYPPLVFQRRIVGTPCAAVFVAAVGTARLLGVTRQLIGETWLGAHGFQYAGSIGPLLFDGPTGSTIERIGNVLSERFELIGLFGVDFVLAGQDVWTVEVNPRYTASVELIERAAGLHAIAHHAEACCRSTMGTPESTASSRPVHGKAILFAKRDLTITAEFAAWSLAEATRRPWPAIADVSPAGTLIETGRPVVTVFATGASATEVEQNLRERVAGIERRLCADM